ncbi:MAG: hypothetical protein JSS50_03545 [Proteobacteria bacterium]|nr:hypothetical protein [Pseudomonadota bacterium]
MKHLLTVKQLVQKHPCFTLGGMRYYIFYAKTNGLEASGAILRLGRKLLIDEEKFIGWIESQNVNSKAAGA